jgi:hypothetical protein
MSVFKVKLNNNKQGRLDINPSTSSVGALGSGIQFDESKQRQIYVAGPNGVYRLLKDGEEFVDCNYWKRFTPEVIGEEYSFIEVINDDGSIYSDISEENTFSVGGTVSLTIDYSDTVIDFVNEHGSPARFVMIQNLDGEIKIFGEINGNSNITFLVGPGETMMFNQGDIVITSLRLKGFSGTPDASYIASIRSVCYS